MRFVRSQVLSLRAVRDSTTEDSTNKKKSGLARLKRFVIKLACCTGMGDSERKFVYAGLREHIFARVEGVAQYGRLPITEVHVLFGEVARS
jgi:hypothetical protein